MNIKCINKQAKDGRIKRSQESNQPITDVFTNVLPTFEEYSYDAAVIHVGINDILRSKDSNILCDLPDNVMKVGKSVRIVTLVKYLYQA